MRCGRSVGGGGGTGAAGAGCAEGASGPEGVIGETYLTWGVVRLQSEPQPFPAAPRPRWYPSPSDCHVENHRLPRRVVPVSRSVLITACQPSDDFAGPP